jgi:starch synthase
MERVKVLYISQEITPYLPESDMSVIARYLPQGIQERGREIRTFMPRYGCINERRNQLHEVIRLSGMNLIINDTDHPLIIKVASIQSARMQVYFIDNEDFFQRKAIITDENGELFPDNDERIIFFARGVLETVKKLRWAPDIIHCHGWFSSIVPLYIKKAYHDEPVFSNSKVIYSIYDNEFKGSLNPELAQKVIYDDIEPKDVKIIEDPTYNNLTKFAVQYSDGIIFGAQNINKAITDFVIDSGKPYLSYQTLDTYIDEYSKFYDQILQR